MVCLGGPLASLAIRCGISENGTMFNMEVNIIRSSAHGCMGGLFCMATMDTDVCTVVAQEI